MGLESVELLMEIEDTFDIKITDEEATGCLTVGDLYECIKEKVDITTVPEKCATHSIFNSIRKIFTDDFGISRKAVVPKAKTETFLPITSRRETWELLSEKLQLDLPRLELSSALVLFYCILCVIFIAVTFAMTWYSVFWFFGISLLWIFFFTTVVRWVSSPLAVVVPSQCYTTGDLVRTMTIKNFQKIEETVGEKDIWNILTIMVSEVTCEKASTLRPETRFVEDLKF